MKVFCQGVLAEDRDLATDPSIQADTRAMVDSGFHALEGKLEIGLLAAKDLIIEWKSAEILRLTRQLGRPPEPRLRQAAKRMIKRRLRRWTGNTLSAKNLVIQQKSAEVLQLAIKLDRTAGPDVSVM